MILIWIIIIVCWGYIGFRIIFMFYNRWEDKQREKRINAILEEHYKKYPQYRYGGASTFPLTHDFLKDEPEKKK